MRIPGNFVFHPVGQGLFYTGRVANFDFVYDCGSDSGKRILRERVSDYRSGANKIDLLVISHLHRDHINGISQLIRGLKVNRVVIPYVYPEELLINFVEAADDGEATEFLRYCANQMYGDGFGTTNLGFDGEVSFLSPKENSGAGEHEVAESALGRFFGHDTGVVAAGGRYVFRFFCFVPKMDAARTLWLDELRAAFGEKWEEDLPGILARDFKKLRSIYNKVFKTHKRINLTSVVCCHGPKSPTRCINLVACYAHPARYMMAQNLRYVLHSRQLLTGDMDLKVAYKKLKAHFKKEWDEIFLCLVPHHGSKENWRNQMFLSLSNCVFWPCAFGLGNGHSHPSSSVVAEFLGRRKNFVQCTQDPASKMMIDAVFSL